MQNAWDSKRRRRRGAEEEKDASLRGEELRARRSSTVGSARSPQKQRQKASMLEIRACDL